jgi:hypothetical protein
MARPLDRVHSSLSVLPRVSAADFNTGAARAHRRASVDILTPLVGPVAFRMRQAVSCFQASRDW